MATEIQALTGSCLCGSVRYQVTRLNPAMAHCHCTMCRKFHGAAFATFGEAKAEDFTWLKGQHLLSQFQADNGTVRQFCKNCGSSLTFSPSGDTGELIEFTLGTLDVDVNLKPDARIFVASKADWVELSDDLPRYKQSRDSEHC